MTLQREIAAPSVRPAEIESWFRHTHGKSARARTDFMIAIAQEMREACAIRRKIIIETFRIDKNLCGGYFQIYNLIC